MTDAPRTLKSVDNACEILDLLRKRDGATISELADYIDLSLGTLHTYLATLRRQGYVVQEGTTYKLGEQFVVFGEYVKNHSALYRAGKGEVDRLADQCDECIHLITEQNGLEISLYEAFGDEAVGKELYIKNREKPRRLLHCTASGKAILAHLSEERTRKIVEKHGLVEQTPNTITDADELFEDIKTIQERGFAVNDEEEMKGMRAVGAPITDANDEVLGAVSLSAPVSRLKGDHFYETTPDLIIRTANIIEVNLQTAEIAL